MNQVMRDRRRSARLARESEAELAKKRCWHPPKFFAWVFICTSSLLLFGLSIWQLDRLAWKQGLIAEISASRNERARDGLPEDISALADMDFKRIALKGEYLHDYEIHLAARYYHSQLGFHILTPFKLEDNHVVLVNRGWVKMDEKLPISRPKGQVSGTQHIIVMVRNDNDRSYFTPNPDKKGNLWFWRDLKSMGDVTGLDFVPTNFDVLYDAPIGGKPLPSDGLIELRNDHLGYAITWFLIGAAGIIMFIMFHYRLPEPAPQDVSA